MSTEASDQLELEIKRLERDKRLEEIRQLRASGRRQWITPTALAALLPLLAGLGVWAFNEMKQYHEGYRALEERDRLAAERTELQQQKDSLNLEVGTLLDLKRHYAEQANDLQARFEHRQQQLDATYARARFATAEARYALSHIEGLGPGPDAAALDALRPALQMLDPGAAETMQQVIERYLLAIDMIAVSEEVLETFDDTLDLVPASDWAVALEYTPSGSIVPGRNIMLLHGGRSGRPDEQYYDVNHERFLTEAAVQAE